MRVMNKKKICTTSEDKGVRVVIQNRSGRCRFVHLRFPPVVPHFRNLASLPHGGVCSKNYRMKENKIYIQSRASGETEVWLQNCQRKRRGLRCKDIRDAVARIVPLGNRFTELYLNYQGPFVLNGWTEVGEGRRAKRISTEA